MTLLTDGLVKAGTECPFKSECNIPCPTGTNYTLDYSCGMARGLDIVYESLERKGVKTKTQHIVST